jgi:hypothetical protein
MVIGIVGRWRPDRVITVQSVQSFVHRLATLIWPPGIILVGLWLSAVWAFFVIYLVFEAVAAIV